MDKLNHTHGVCVFRISVDDPAARMTSDLDAYSREVVSRVFEREVPTNVHAFFVLDEPGSRCCCMYFVLTDIWRTLFTYRFISLDTS